MEGKPLENRAMRRRNSQRSRIRNKFKLKQILFLSIAVTVFLSACFFAILQNIPKQSSASRDPMVIASVSVINDSVPMVRGGLSQMLIGVNIKTKGSNYKLNATGIKLRLNLPGQILPDEIGNIRIWYNGSSPDFQPAKPVSDYGSVFRGSNWISISQILQDGDNFFFISCDVLASTKPLNGFIEVGCDEIRIGTLTYEPEGVNKPGKRKVLNNIPYFSTGNGDISSLSSWNSKRDGSGNRPVNFGTANATYHIQAGHVMKNSLHACIPVLVIERNAMLQSTSTIKARLMKVRSGGTYLQSALFSNPAALDQLLVESGGVYLHKNKGAIAGKVKIFAPRSTAILADFSAVTFSEKIKWGNLIIDSDSGATTDFGTSLNEIRGDFEIRKTGTSGYLYTSQDCSMRIEGDFVISGGTIHMAPKGNQVLIKIDGAFVVRDGIFSDLASSKQRSANGSVTIFTGYRFMLKSGTFTLNSPASAIVTGSRKLDWIQTHCEVILPSIRVLEGCTLLVKADTIGPFASHQQLLINKGGVFDAGSAIVSGEGAFTLLGGSVFMTSHPEGINSDTSLGNIRTSKRHFDSDASYVFYGSARIQQTGSFNTQPEQGVVRDFTIMKEHPGDVVVLSQPLKIRGVFYKKTGSLNKQAHEFAYTRTVTGATQMQVDALQP